jgi:PTS system galactitol-specific IIB component
MKKEINVLTVCGSGVVSSSMLGSRVKEILEKVGIYANILGTQPQMVKSYVDKGKVDLVVTSSPISDLNSVPVIKGIPLLTGVGEEECIEEIIKIAKEIVEKKST